jgi:hypothetical protein
MHVLMPGAMHVQMTLAMQVGTVNIRGCRAPLRVQRGYLQALVFQRGT